VTGTEVIVGAAAHGGIVVASTVAVAPVALDAVRAVVGTVPVAVTAEVAPAPPWVPSVVRDEPDPFALVVEDLAFDEWPPEHAATNASSVTAVTYITIVTIGRCLGRFM
jgi:hypothetical protein